MTAFLWTDDTEDQPPALLPGVLELVRRTRRGRRVRGRKVAVPDIPVGPRPSGTAVKRSK